VDLLVCNPPYISSKKVDVMPNEIINFEPRLAFDGGPLGIRILQRLIREAPRFLRKGGALAFEVGLGQGPAIIQRLNHANYFTDISPISDSNSEIRGIVAIS
jgi:release factor glutamine methyltransferase